MSGWIAVKTAVGYIQDLVGKFCDVGFVLGSRCGSLAVGDNPVDDDAAAAASKNFLILILNIYSGRFDCNPAVLLRKPGG